MVDVGKAGAAQVADGARRLLDRPALVVTLATVAMAVATLWELGDHSLWLDEGFTVMHTRLPDDRFLPLLAKEANASLHSVLLHGWVQVSEAAWWVRLPSAVAATAAVPVTYLLGRRLFGTATGCVAAVLFATNGFVVEYGQEARGYALLILVSAAAGLLFVRFLQEQTTASWLAWVVVASLLGYAHFYGVFVLGAQVLVLVGRRHLPTPWTKVWQGLAVIALAHLPLAAFFVFGGDQGQSGGIPELTLARLVGVFARLSGNLGIPLALLVAVPCVVALVDLVRGRHQLDERRWGVLFLTTWILLPIVTVAVLSLAKPLYGARYFVEVIPALAVLTARGLSLVRLRTFRLALGTAIVLLGAAAVVVWHVQPPREDAQGVAELLASPGDGVQEGDVVLFAPWYARIPVELYLEDHDDVVARLEPGYPDAAWGTWEPDEDPGHLDADVLAAAASGTDRVWLVSRASDDGAHHEVDTAREQLEHEGFEPAFRRDLDGLEVERYDRT
jgi:mannosyltransferase